MFIKWAYYTGILGAIAILSAGLKPFQLQNHAWFNTESETNLTYSLPSSDAADYEPFSIVTTQKFFKSYKEAIGRRESRGQYRLVSAFGYMGKYQFGKSALRAIGISDFDHFLKTPELQEKAFVALCAKNKFVLRDEIEKYEGKVVGGVRVTESGILAAAHLVGAGSVKNYFKSNGKRRIRDGYGTSLKSYLKQFGGYETSHIQANDHPVIRI